MSMRIRLAAVVLITSLVCAPMAIGQTESPKPSELPGLIYDAPFFPGSAHDPAIPTPDAVLGFPVGSRPANHAQIEAVFKAIAANNPRTKLVEYARSFEGRSLYYLVISSEANITKLDQIKADAANLADPRSMPNKFVDQLAADTPAIAWMGYTIHGDEMSGSDAAMAAAWHLASSVDEDVKKFRDNVVVIIDPLMNPDGRDRCLRTIAENRTAQPSVDDQSVMHSLVWPSGRMNHYLFDLNRDWIFATQPESRGRIVAAGSWHPHYFMESHEMGSQDTFLFQPPRAPINPNIPGNVHKWLDVFARDHAAAFDKQGWRYYHGEWNEEWYPGYSGAWGALRGAVENLYEQASIGTDAVRRLEGRLETYREAVHHQLVSTMANLNTLNANRQAVINDYVASRRANIAADGKYAKRTFAVAPTGNAARIKSFIDLMLLQGFEVHTAKDEFTTVAKDRLGRVIADKKFPAGTLLVAARQPEGPLVAAMLEFDPRMTDAFLTEERRELLRFNRSRLYDVTAWNIPMFFDVETYELSMDLPPGARKLESPNTAAPSPIENANTTVGFVVTGADDRSMALAGRLMERGVFVRVSDKPFVFDGRSWPRGSLVITRIDNLNFSGNLNDVISAAAAELGVQAVGIGSGLGPGDIPDLGGEHFVLLLQPRIAVMGREPFRPYSYGEIWYLIDHKLGLRASYLDATQADQFDLRRYNVLVLPEGADETWLKDKTETLKAWVEDGGTLIAIGSSAATLAKDKTGIGSVRLLPDVLDKSNEQRQAIARQWEGWTGNADASKTWMQTPPAQLTYPWLIGESGEKPAKDELERRDAWRAIFMPQGAILAARVDDRSYLTAGCGEYLPVLYRNGAPLMTFEPTQAPLRLGAIVPAPPGGTGILPVESGTTQSSSTQPASAPIAATQGASTQPEASAKLASGWTLAPPGHELRLRMSGLLWPEAADRLAHTAYMTREPLGRGQIILFADSPTVRAATLGTTRVLTNAIICGPGMGATQAIEP